MSESIKKKTETNPTTDDELRIEHVIAQIQEYHSGPLPPPGVIKQYNEIIPGSAERILKMAEKEQEHRFEMNKQTISIDKWGQRYAFLIATLGLSMSGFLAYLGETGFAMSTSISTIGGIVTAYIYGQKKQKDKESKQ